MLSGGPKGSQGIRSSAFEVSHSSRIRIHVIVIWQRHIFLHSPSTYTQSIPKYINMPVPWVLWTGVCSPIWTPSPTFGSLVGSEFVHLSCISQLGNGHVLEVDSVTNTRQPIREKNRRVLNLLGVPAGWLKSSATH